MVSIKTKQPVRLDKSLGQEFTPIQSENLANELLRLATDGEAVSAFCHEHHIVAEAQVALQLAQKHFANCRINVSVEDDPDDDGAWLAIDVYSSSEPDDALAAFGSYTAAWVRAVAADKILLVRLIINYG